MILIIKNLTLNKEIIFPDSPQIIIHPHEYDDDPYVEIKIGGDFHFLRHSHTCEDCGIFIKEFGTDSLNWFVLYNNNKYRLDMSGLGGQSSNKILYKTSTYEFGSTLKLYFSKVPIEIEELEKLLASLVQTENYEKACDIRDLIDLEKNN
jgi:hypothetical protein